MKDFRGPLPLDDRDFAEIRAHVLRRKQRRPIALPIALAAAAMIGLVVFLIPGKQPAPVNKPPVAIHRPIVIAPVQITETPAPPSLRPAPKPRRKPQLVASSGGPPPDTEITMNIQTADPNVRIIWIARR